MTVRTTPFYLLLAACLTCAGGCYGVSHNPTWLPHLFPFGDIVRTHAKPPGFAYFWNFDRKAQRIEVKPVETTAPAGTQQVFIATILDDDGKPRRNRRIEWVLEGAGSIIEVDESGFFPGRGYKVTDRYAVTYTDWLEHTITRGNEDPADDFVIQPGQSWCVVSSANEGDTKVIVYAPEIYNWDNRKVAVTMHWADALWRLPPPVASRSGSQPVLTTAVFRPSDQRPLANYLVRYRIIDGPPAVFLPARAAEAVAVTDISGLASVTLAQLEPRAGANRIGIEIIRGPDPTAPSGAGIPIGRGETRVDWQAAQLSLSNNAAPTAGLNQDVTYTLQVANIGQVETQEMTLRDVLGEGLQYVRAEPPPALVEGRNQLVWTLPGLPPGQSHTIGLVCRTNRGGPVTTQAVVATRDGLREERSSIVQVSQARLDVQMDAPAVAAVGVPVDFQITLSNPGTGAINAVQLVDAFDPGLEHETRANPIKKTVGPLMPGQKQEVTLRLIPRQSGRFVNRIEATADGGLQARTEHTVDVRNAQLKVELQGPTRRFLNRPANWEIKVSNPGDFPLKNVVVRDLLPQELAFAGAGQGGIAAPSGEVVWTIAQLGPGQQQVLELATNAVRLAPKAVNVVTASAEGLQARDESAIEINGLPAYKVTVQDAVDPVEVGRTTTYQIEVINQGTLPGRQIEIIALVPPQVKVANTRGPASPPKLEAGRVVFPVLDTLPVGQKIGYAIEVQAVAAGRAIVQVELKSATLREPVIEQESTTIIDPNQPEAPAPSREPPLSP